jgi:hypothetical protein
MDRLKSVLTRSFQLLASPKAFYSIVALFCIQALWIALSNRYPMAFDEDYHLGIIRLYAEHGLPFWSSQPTGADTFGPVYRDPSYLYHYTMSFIYRFIALFTDNQSAQVILLRVLNIGFLATSLPIFRALLKKLGASNIVTNFVLLLYVLIPVLPLLAAQINYDNVFIPLVALLLYWLTSFSIELWRYKRTNTRLLIYILILGVYGSLVKYPFLPFALAATACVAILMYVTYRSGKKALLSLGFGLTLMTKRLRWILLALFIIGTMLFAERYGMNLLRYQTPVPPCHVALSEQQCRAYGPWLRDATLENNKQDGVSNPFPYAWAWIYGMWFRLFFTVDGPPTGYQTRGPLTLPGLSAAAFGVASMTLCGIFAMAILKRHRVLLPALAVCLFYITVLFLDGLEAYLRTGKPVAINGRYLLPVLPVLFLLAVYAWEHLLGSRPILKRSLATLAILGMVWGGGVLTFILRSSDVWYWDNATVRSVNFNVRNVVGPITPGADMPTQYLP